MTKLLLAGFALMALSACGAETSGGKGKMRSAASLPANAASNPGPAGSSNASAAGEGLAGLIGRDAAALRNQFGTPRLDIREEVGRKLQFAGGPCILDIYLYADGNGQERVTHIDARRSDGAAVDRASCVKALSGQ